MLVVSHEPEPDGGMSSHSLHSSSGSGHVVQGTEVSRDSYEICILIEAQVGLLPMDNIEQLDFAFSIYQTTGRRGVLLSSEFKETFA